MSITGVLATAPTLPATVQYLIAAPDEHNKKLVCHRTYRRPAYNVHFIRSIRRPNATDTQALHNAICVTHEMMPLCEVGCREIWLLAEQQQPDRHAISHQ